MLRTLNKLVVPIIALLFVLAIVLFATTYTVRFTELAVVTTFGKAGDGAIKTEPGLYFKWPYPVQSVTKYDQRVRLVTTRSETQQTADDFQIIVEGYLTYRVVDPLLFFQSFSDAGDRAEDHFGKAERDVLRDRLRSTLGETSRYRMGDLFASDGAESRLPELEDRVLELMRSGGEGAGDLRQTYGVEIVAVGIDRIVLPEDTTTKVIERMGANRDRLAAVYQSQGEAVARRIQAEADSAASKITQFALRRATEIRAEGRKEAAPFYRRMQEVDPELAVFLEKLDLLRNAYAKRATLIWDTDAYGMEVFDPDLMGDLEDGDIPGSMVGGNEGE